MPFKNATKAALATVLLIGALPAQAQAAANPIPEWVKPAVRYLSEAGALDRSTFETDAPMHRRAFKNMMDATFGGGYKRVKGKITAGEVSAALVRATGFKPLADQLNDVRSPDGWDPGVGKRFGTEVVSRELGLRRDRPTSEESLEAGARDLLTQGDVAWATWTAATDPDEWAAGVLSGFTLGSYEGVRREVVAYALSLAGTPYVWGGEWLSPTPAGYPFGAQSAGGVDCSGFLWNVLKAKSSSYSPAERPYKGWTIDERSSADMARGTARSKRLGYNKLIAGDIVLFAPKGKDDRLANVYHAALYLGDGWIVHSSGSRAGVSIGSIAPGSWWHDQIVFGRRIIPN
jgi:cell wall-associated NlpC family hydrolase